MATIGDLVVNLTANSKQFSQGMATAERTMRRVGGSAVALASAIGGAMAIHGLSDFVKQSLQAAANVETLATQFTVLTGDAESAAAVMKDVTELAASTPFQKSELSQAGRSLLAFGTEAADVVGVLRQIGDIASLTGNRIGDIAEIYGKARVQGRLFAEDINQLTGRGIPIIQELAKQFGVTESEVKKLVETGQVGFANIEQAFEDMTTGSGKFAGGMEKLSETTAGRLSTLRDQFEQIAATIGETLLPMVNKLADTLSSLFAEDGPALSGLQKFVKGMDDLSAAMSAFEGGILNPGVNLNKLQEQEVERIEKQQQAARNKANEKFRQADANQRAAVPAVIPGTIPESLIGRVAGDMERVIPKAVTDGFADAGKFLNPVEQIQESANRADAVQFAGAAERGSQEAYQVIARNVFGGKSNVPQDQLNEAKKTNQLLAEQIQLEKQKKFGGKGMVVSEFK